MDIVGFSDKTAIAVIESGVESPAGLYRMTLEDWLKLPLFSDKKAVNMLNSVEKSKDVILARFVDALGIPGVGKMTARALALYCGTLDSIINAGEGAFTEVADIGPVTARTLADYFADEVNRREIAELLEAGIRISEMSKPPVKTNEDIHGKSFCLTGTLSGMTRDEATAKIEAAGGKVTGGVTGKTDVLITGEGGGGKRAKAETLGVEIWDEITLIQKLSIK